MTIRLFLASVVAIHFAACASHGTARPVGTQTDMAIDATIPIIADPTGWRTVGKLSIARGAHTATLLSSGKVLIVGGEKEDRTMVDSVEIYDPQSMTFSTLTPLPEPRSNHMSTLLGSGLVLIAGGGRANQIGVPEGTEVRNDALLYDPEQGTYTRTAPMSSPREFGTAVLLSSGQVLVVGGANDMKTMEPLLGGSANGYVGHALSSAELYDATSNTWTVTGSMTAARFLHTATKLKDGRVLVTGGATDVSETSLKSCELFDLQTQTWSMAASFNSEDRLFHVATLLDSGQVLMAAGKESNTSFLSSAELFDPGSSSWTATARISPARTLPTILTLKSGNALVVGGYNCGKDGCASLDDSPIYDAKSETWSSLSAPLVASRFNHTATLLDSGEVLVVGGLGDLAELNDVEISTGP